MTRSNHRLLPRILLSLGTVVVLGVALIAVEVALAAFDLYPPTDASPVHFTGASDGATELVMWDADLLYRFPPDSDFLGYYRTNAHGYRGVSWTERKPDGTIRIVCVGDSCTFGLGVREEETYWAQLERMLDFAYGGERSFEVVSLGIPGYSSFQNRRQIEIEAPRFEADVVVWMPTGVNDASIGVGAGDAERARRHRSLRHRVARSRLLRMLGASEPQLDRAPAAEFAAENDEFPVRVDLDEYEDNLRVAAGACRRRGTPLVVLRFQLAPRVYQRDPGLRDREEVVARVVDDLGLVAADPRPAIADVAPYPMHVDQIHPSPRGHRALAASLFSTLVTRGILPDDDRRRFLARFLEARDEGVVEEDAEWVAAAASPVRAMLAADAWDVDNDPLAAEGRSFYANAWRWLRRLSGETTPDEDARIDEIDRVARPHEPFRTLLFGQRGPTAQSDDVVRLARALATFDAAVGLSSPPVDRRLGDAIVAYESGDLLTAYERLEEVLALHPTSIEALFRKVQVAWKGRRLGQALTALQELERVAPEHPRYLVAAGLVATERGRYDEALPLLLRAVEQEPMSGDAHFALGYVYFLRGDMEKATESLYVAGTILPSVRADAAALLGQVPARKD